MVTASLAILAIKTCRIPLRRLGGHQGTPTLTQDFCSGVMDVVHGKIGVKAQRGDILAQID